MSLRNYPTRFLVTAAASSLLLLGSSVVVAVYLNREQARTAQVLGENIGSRRAATNLEETLTDLIALHRRGTEAVEPLHDRVRIHLAEIKQFADKPEELKIANDVEASFSAYLQLLKNGGGGPAAADLLQSNTLPACVDLREFNALQIDESEREHQRVLQRLAWGFAAVGTLGSSAGLIMGYGLARGLRRAVDSLLVQVQGASDLLGQELATVTVAGGGRSAPDEIDALVHRVGEVVRALQQREREVRRAERLAAVGQLAAGMAHEVRNPLTSVQLLIQTVRRDPTAGGLDANDLELIDAELGRIEQSLKAFLNYARPAKPERIACDLTHIASATLNLLRARVEQQKVTVRFRHPAVPVALLADPEQIRQVFVNLVLNALDAMPVGGTLEVAIDQNADTVSLVVADSGAGISADILPRLFEPFATGKETGLGLGLVVSKRIVEDHGGTIRGANRPQGGAEFVVQLPHG